LLCRGRLSLTVANQSGHFSARWLHPDDAAKVEAIGIGDHAAMDMHVGSGGGVPLAKGVFDSHPNLTMGACNAETNGGSHGMDRALDAAIDLISWFNCAEAFCSRLHFRAESFCTERSGHFDEFDQGISFFLVRNPGVELESSRLTPACGAAAESDVATAARVRALNDR